VAGSFVAHRRRGALGTVLMPMLRCTVRGCAGPLTLDGSQARCPNGHAFDRAREGYWNLLQPQDRRSPRAGDRAEAVIARRRWLARGFVTALAAKVAGLIDARRLPAGAAAVDVGCGEGTLTGQLLGARELDAAGVDLSAKAIALAARADPRLTWIVANADRALPFVSGSVQLAVSIFGRRPVSELHRVLAPDGSLIVVVPAEDDLIELREASQGQAVRRDRVADVLFELAPSFTPASRASFRHAARHDREALEDALAMSYRGARAKERERLGGLAELTVTLSAEILELVPVASLR